MTRRVLLIALLSGFVALGMGADTKEKPILRLDTGGHMAMVNMLAFSSDGRELYTASDDKTVQVWDVETGERVRVLRGWIGPGHEGKLLAMDVSPDGRLLAAGGALKGTSHQDMIRLLDPSSGAVLALLRGHTNVVYRLKFSPDGRHLASASWDQSVRVWVVGSALGGGLNSPHRTLKGHSEPVRGLAWSPDSRRIASGGGDGMLVLWDAASGEQLRSTRASQEDIAGCAFSPDGGWIATGANDGRVKLWDGATLAEIRTVARVEKGNLSEVAFSPLSQPGRGGLLACGGSYCEERNGAFVKPVFLHDPATGRRVHAFWEHSNTIAAIAFRPEVRGVLGRRTAAQKPEVSGEAALIVASNGGHDHETFIWNASTGKALHRICGRGRTVWACAFGRDGRSIYWGNIARGSPLTMPIAHGFSLEAFQLLPSDQVQSAAYRRVIHEAAGKTFECEGRSCRPEITIAGHKVNLPDRKDTIKCFTFTPDGGAAVVGSDYALHRFDTATGKRTVEFVGHEGVVWAVSPSPDGRRLLSASSDQTLKLWDLHGGETPTPRQTLSQGNIKAVEDMGHSKYLDAVDGNVKLKEIFEADENLKKYADLFEQPAISRPLASFFATPNGEWVLWTQSGYYASSARGDELIGWHINRGEDEAAEFCSASQFRAIYDRPDVVQATLRLGSEALGLKVANQTSRRHRQSLRPEQLEQVRPPKITFVSPPEGFSTRAERATVQFQIESVRQLTEVRVSVNGRRTETGRGFGGLATGADLRSVTVPLESGLNRITVFASHDLATAEATRRVRRPAAAAAALLHRLFLVAVGVARYDHLPADAQLSFADDDAREVAQTFSHLKGKLFREVRTTVLAGPGTDGRPTRDAIEEALDLFGEAGQYDTCVLFIAGHGVTDIRDTYFFVPSNGRFKSSGDPIKSAVVRWSTIKDALDVPGRKIMLVDTCHAAASSGIKRRSLNNDDLVKQIGDETTVVLTSCRGREKSVESTDWGHGAFTKCLLDGLRGKQADLIKDGRVSIKELDTYISETVPKLTQGGQHPITFAPKGYESFVIYR